MISIIMIAYNVEAYIRRAIESVLAQTYKDIELIIVSSPGKDACEDICREYAGKDARIKHISCPPKGEADARNHGLAAVTGEYLGFVDADDYVEPRMFESMLENITKYDADIAVCGRFYEYKNTTLSDTAKPPVVLNASEAVAVTLGHDGFFLHCWDKLFTRKIFEGLTFTDIAVEDRVVVDRLLSSADRIVYDPTPMYHFRERSGSGSKRAGIVRQIIEANSMMEDFIKKEHPELSDECNRFMLYEYITAMQNELVGKDPDKNDLAEYARMVRKYKSVPNPLVGRTLKIKTFLALNMPGVLKLYTKKRQGNTAEKLERFP